MEKRQENLANRETVNSRQNTAKPAAGIRPARQEAPPLDFFIV